VSFSLHSSTMSKMSEVDVLVIGAGKFAARFEAELVTGRETRYFGHLCRQNLPGYSSWGAFDNPR
jgi:hypothetical protein